MSTVSPGQERTQLLKGVLDAVVLAALADRDGYGYDVVRRLRLGGLDEVADASVYGTLRRLFAQGLLTSYVVPSDEGPHRKYYGLTAMGRKALDVQRSEWLAFSATVARILDGEAFTVTTGDEPWRPFTSMGVSDYARAVRDELRDLTPEQAHAVLDGLDEHLAEIVAEGTTDLEVALGSPKVYAAELRASAGLPAESRPGPSTAWSAPSISPEPSTTAPFGDDDLSEAGDDADGDELASERPSVSGRQVAVARGVLVAALGLLAVVVIRVSSPANGLTIVAIAAAVGGLWWLLDRVGRYAALPEWWATRLPVTLAGAAIVLAVLLGAQLTEDGTTTYVDNFPTETTVFFGSGFVEVPSLLGVAYRDAVQTLNASGFAVIVEGADGVEPITVDSMIVTTMFPGPGEVTQPGSVISLTLTAPTSVSPLPTVGPEPVQTNAVTTLPPATVVATTEPLTATTLPVETTLAPSTTDVDSTLGGTTTIGPTSP